MKKFREYILRVFNEYYLNVKRKNILVIFIGIIALVILYGYFNHMNLLETIVIPAILSIVGPAIVFLSNDFFIGQNRKLFGSLLNEKKINDFFGNDDLFTITPNQYKDYDKKLKKQYGYSSEQLWDLGYITADANIMIVDSWRKKYNNSGDKKLISNVPPKCRLFAAIIMNTNCDGKDYQKSIVENYIKKIEEKDELKDLRTLLDSKEKELTNNDELVGQDRIV